MELHIKNQKGKRVKMIFCYLALDPVFVECNFTEFLSTKNLN